MNDRKREILNGMFETGKPIDKVVEKALTALNALDRSLDGGKVDKVIEENEVFCGRCEGNGKLWKDGQAHSPSYKGETVLCGECGGKGFVYSGDLAHALCEAHMKGELYG